MKDNFNNNFNSDNHKNGNHPADDQVNIDKLKATADDLFEKQEAVQPETEGQLQAPRSEDIRTDYFSGTFSPAPSEPADAAPQGNTADGSSEPQPAQDANPFQATPPAPSGQVSASNSMYDRIKPAASKPASSPLYTPPESESLGTPASSLYTSPGQNTDDIASSSSPLGNSVDAPEPEKDNTHQTPFANPFAEEAAYTAHTSSVFNEDLQVPEPSSANPFGDEPTFATPSPASDSTQVTEPAEASPFAASGNEAYSADTPMQDSPLEYGRTAEEPYSPSQTLAGGEESPVYRNDPSSGYDAGQQMYANTPYANDGYGSSYSGQNQNAPYSFNYNDYDRMQQSTQTAAIPKKRRGLAIFAIIISLFFVASLVLLSLYMVKDSGSTLANTSSSDEGSSNNLNINSTPDNTSVSNGDILSTEQIAEKVIPSVVGIVVYSQMDSYTAAGQGSGVIMTADGYIISNAHVFVDELGQTFKRIQVIMHDGTDYEATLIGLDTSTDLAVIKINPTEEITPAEFGDSTQLKVGETVVAIGNPTGMTLASSVTKGIVSGVDRDISTASGGSAYATTFIQTDAAINPGNSGGALVNQYGQVVGINSAKIASEEYEGLGFAIPISEAQSIIDDLINNGAVQRVRLGITYSEVDEVTARVNEVPQGLLIQSIDEQYNIASSGAQTGDIITSVDGQDVKVGTDLTSVLNSKSAGDSISLGLYRTSNGQELTVEFEVEYEKTSVS